MGFVELGYGGRGLMESESVEDIARWRSTGPNGKVAGVGRQIVSSWTPESHR